ncbi:hypothetical protein [Scytonema hofmannii]|nr:hypothetical protein [Scytonema hofmannii]
MPDKASELQRVARKLGLSSVQYRAYRIIHANIARLISIFVY